MYFQSAIGRGSCQLHPGKKFILQLFGSFTLPLLCTSTFTHSRDIGRILRKWLLKTLCECFTYFSPHFMRSDLNPFWTKRPRFERFGHIANSFFLSQSRHQSQRLAGFGKFWREWHNLISQGSSAYGYHQTSSGTQNLLLGNRNAWQDPLSNRDGKSASLLLRYFSLA